MGIFPLGGNVRSDFQNEKAENIVGVKFLSPCRDEPDIGNI